MTETKKLHIKTYGCQMNVYDSHRMADVMAPFGYEQTDTLDESVDMVILNTCHIREKAAEKIYSELGRIRAVKEARLASLSKEMKIVVAGCVGQAEGEEIFKRAPVVDIVVGPQSYQTLPELLTKIDAGARHAINLDFPDVQKFDELPEINSDQGPAAFLSVQEGCDKFCTFCVVPYTRGAEYSRPIEVITREAMEMVARGTKEITLLGQNVTAFHGISHDGQEWPLGKLIRHLSTITGLERIRYTTSHPRDMDEDIIAAHRDIPKLMPYLHLPVQAGSNRILKAMNRKHTAEDYLEVIAAFREARPDMAFSGDFIVGFPGETDEDFEATLDVVRKVHYAQAYSFKYSPRPGTPAATDKNQVPEDVKTERLARLQQLLNAQQHAFNLASIGKTMDILFDRKGKEEGQLIGRSPYMQSVVMNLEPEYKGQIVTVKITEAFANSLRAVLP